MLSKNSLIKIKFFLLFLSVSASCVTTAKEENRGSSMLIDFEEVVKTDSLISPRDLFSEVDFVLLKTPDSLRVTIAGKIKEGIWRHPPYTGRNETNPFCI